jgi:small subunit ribosomal protein S1
MTENSELENETNQNEASEATSENVASNASDETNAQQVSDEGEVAVEEKPVIKAPRIPDPNFDWDLNRKGGDSYRPEERQELESKYANTLTSIAEFDVVPGTVVLMNDRDVVVNIGFKSDGLVPLSEFRDMPNLKLGDKVDVFIESQEDKNGQLILSHKKAIAFKSWDRVNAALETQEIVHGYIKCRTKGGLIVDVFGLEAFLPGSQIDVRPIKDFDQFVGKTMEFKVVKINQEFKNVVVSHKILIEAELESQRGEIMSKLEKGQVIEGIVKNLTHYGAFLDLGGVDGLLHITDMAWGRIAHPEEILQIDQKINVVILDFDDEKKRIALGLKQLTPHPWESAVSPDLKVGDKVKGKITVIADYGAFMEIAPGVEGLIHVSEMSWSQHLRSPQDFIKVGEEVEAVVLTLNREERKMSFGIKQLKPDPWINIKEKYPVGSKHKAVVRNFMNFGVFVELEEGIDGLIHISDLSWSKRIRHPAEFAKIGDTLEVLVLEVDPESRRLALGVKQLEENPWDVFETIFTEGSVHKGTVVKIIDKGAFISLPYGVEGYTTMKHLIKENKMPAKVDDVLDFKVMEFNKENKRIFISHAKYLEDKALASKEKEGEKEKETEKENTQVVEKLNSSAEKSTLGDLEALSALKSEMETSELESAHKKAKELTDEAPKVKKPRAKAKKADENKGPEISNTSENESKTDEQKVDEDKPTDV